MNKCCTPFLLAASLLVLPASGQAGEDAQYANGYPLLELSQIQVTSYNPKNVRSDELYATVQGMVGRSVLVKERGASSRPVSDLSLLGSSIVIYDTADYSKKVLETLVALDVPQGPETSQQERTSVMLEYTPKHVSARSLRIAIEPFLRGRGYCEILDNRTLALGALEESAPALLDSIKRLDIPEPQVSITCHLLTGGDVAEEATAAPGFTPSRELITNLESILPNVEFKTLGFSMVQSAVLPGRPVSLSISTKLHGGFELGFTPVAYDSETGNMTVSDCTVARAQEIYALDGSVVNKVETLLRTDTIFRGEQYTVLGASGADPVFVVVRMRRMP